MDDPAAKLSYHHDKRAEASLWILLFVFVFSIDLKLTQMCALRMSAISHGSLSERALAMSADQVSVISQC